MIEKGKIPVAIVSFDLKPTKPGKTYQYRSPYHDLTAGDIVVVNNENGIALARVVDITWVFPGPVVADNTCVIAYIDTARHLTEAMQTQALTHAEACKELQQIKQQNKQRKEEIEMTIRELQKEILKLVKELDTL